MVLNWMWSWNTFKIYVKYMKYVSNTWWGSGGICEHSWDDNLLTDSSINAYEYWYECNWNVITINKIGLYIILLLTKTLNF